MPARLDCGKRPPLSEWKSNRIRAIHKYAQVDVNFEKNHVNNLGARIIGGTESTMGEWPWQVSLLLRNVQYGGGAILSNNFILTSAHLFISKIFLLLLLNIIK